MYMLILFLLVILQVVASQDWPEVTKYAGLVSAQAHRQELIQDLFKVWQDPQRGTVTGGMIKYGLVVLIYMTSCHLRLVDYIFFILKFIRGNSYNITKYAGSF